MKNNNRILPVLYCVLGLTLSLQAQQTNESFAPVPHQEEETIIRIALLARSYGDSIVLRWAPDNAVAWSATNRYGYTVERSFISDDGEYTTEILSPEEGLLPWSLEEMMDFFDPSDSLAAIAAEVLHGEALAAIFMDDGGSDNFVDNLIKQSEMQDTRFAFAMQAAEFSPGVANAMALRWVDHDVKPGVIYEYVVKALTPETLVDIRNGSTILRCMPPDSLPAPEEIDVRQHATDRVEVAWSRGRHSAYYIERSTDGGNTFRQVNYWPYFSTRPDPRLRQSAVVEFYSAMLEYYHVYSDTITPGITYHYRVRGIDAFSDLSEYTEVVSITPVDLDPPTPPVLNAAETLQDTIIRISWTKEEVEPDLAGYRIEKATSPFGPWNALTEELLPATATKYTDLDAIHTRGGYYRVIAEDHSGNQTTTVPIRGHIHDNIPPSIPSGLTGIVYLDGVVELFWDHSPEVDVRGYRIAYANQANHEFVQRTPTPVKENYFRDSIPVKTLTRKIYYKVLAEDYSGNRSEYTEILELTRPDVIPPVTPVLTDARQDTENIYIHWSPSPSDDVWMYRIFRKQQEDELWELMKILETREAEGGIQFTDTPAPSPQPYLYAIEAIDEAGNASELSRLVSFRMRGKAVPEIPIHFTAEFDEEARQVLLHWECDPSFSYNVTLLRAVGDSPLLPFTTLASSETSYHDSRFRPGSVLTYAVRLQLEDGRQSQPSETVEITIP